MKKYIVTREVTVQECPWLTKNMEAGTVVYHYFGPTYGCISDGTAVTFEPNETPFFELPDDALISPSVKENQ
jgi:hypothetical protein